MTLGDNYPPGYIAPRYVLGDMVPDDAIDVTATASTSRRFLDDLDRVLAAAGLDVVALDGWATRSRGGAGYDTVGGAPWCVMWHHTASGGNGANDANYCTFGSSDAPVCNVVIGRDGLVYLCAAGATNTNGKGGPLTLPDGRVVPVDAMNARAFGIEMSNNGVGMSYPQVQIDACYAVSNAVAAAYIGRVDNLAGHIDWTTRKIDPATAAAVQGPWTPASINSSGSWRLADVRAEAVRRAGTPIPPPHPGDDDMTSDQANQLTELYLTVINGVMPQLESLNTRMERTEVRQQTMMATAGVDDPTM